MLQSMGQPESLVDETLGIVAKELFDLLLWDGTGGES